MPNYSFVVYAHPNGEEVIKMYENPENIPNPKKPFEVLIFIETDDGKFDFGKIVRVKFGPAVIDDLRYKFTHELPWKDTDPKDIADLFINRSFAISNNVNFNQAKDEVQKDDGTIKDLLVKAIRYEYDNQKFDDFSWFILILKGAEYVDLNMPNWAFGIGHWLRTKKYKEDKYWNGDLSEKEYTPAFMPNHFFYDKKEDRITALKKYFNQPYVNLKAEINEKISGNDPISRMIRDQLNRNIDECQKTTDTYLEKLADVYIPDGNFQIILKHYHAFEVGVFNGILEFLAGLCDLFAIILLISRDELGFRMTDKLNEKFENLVNDIFYNTFELLKKILKKIFEILKDFGKWYLTYEGKSYFLLKELGELVPDIITFVIPILKGSKAAKITTVAGKEVIEDATEKAAIVITEEEVNLISKTAKEALETGKTKEATEKAVKETEQKIEEKAPIYEELEEVIVKRKKYKNFQAKITSIMNKVGNYSKTWEMDCSEVAEEILESVGEGKIVRIEPKNLKEMRGHFYGKIDTWEYHEIFIHNKIVYDPWFSNIPISYNKYLSELNKLNPKGLIIKQVK